MKNYRLFFGFLLTLVIVLFCVSCSRQSDSGGSGVNIFRPNSSRIEQYNRPAKGTQRPEINSMSQSMKNMKYENDNETLFGYLAAVIGFIALIVLGVLFERYLVYRMKVTADSPAALFVELCSAHQLTRMERNLVERVAEAADINDPLPIFVEPQYLLDAIENVNFRNYRQMIEYLLTKLFESKSESSVIKRSSILLQSELESDSKIEPKSESNAGATASTVIYPTTQNIP
ncbi:MAG: hypothetical protein LBJ00_12150 [Planctomycetaceae bacterium]|nr:hypothetical protein [Planctomycetaceae bacterium]